MNGDAAQNSEADLSLWLVFKASQGDQTGWVPSLMFLKSRFQSFVKTR